MWEIKLNVVCVVKKNNRQGPGNTSEVLVQKLGLDQSAPIKEADGTW